MSKSYEERLKAQGYTDEMLELNRLMHELAHKKVVVRVVDYDDKEYKGIACSYIKPDDEEDGFSTMCIEPKNSNSGWCLGVNEIKSIEEIEEA